MCGRYVFADGRNQWISGWIEQARKRLSDQDFEQLSLFEVFPGSHVLAMIYYPQKRQMQMAPMHWGYPAKDGRLIINARSETAEQLPFFRDSHRCVIPASGYYEWSANPRVKYYFTIPQEEVLYLAGICRRDQGVLSFVILTENAGMPQASVHPRQPVIFQKKDAASWCSGQDSRILLQHSIQSRTMTRQEAQNRLP
jgi:putative SOS response-associated peptidase YedK